jgi:hypothetical protein
VHPATQNDPARHCPLTLQPEQQLAHPPAADRPLPMQQVPVPRLHPPEQHSSEHVQLARTGLLHAAEHVVLFVHTFEHPVQPAGHRLQPGAQLATLLTWPQLSMPDTVPHVAAFDWQSS